MSKYKKVLATNIQINDTVYLEGRGECIVIKRQRSIDGTQVTFTVHLVQAENFAVFKVTHKTDASLSVRC